MSSSGFSGFMESVRCRDYEFTRFASPAPRYFWRRKRQSFWCFHFSEYNDILKVARDAIGKKRYIFKVVFAAIRSDKNMHGIVIFDDVIEIG